MVESFKLDELDRCILGCEARRTRAALRPPSTTSVRRAQRPSITRGSEPDIVGRGTAPEGGSNRCHATSNKCLTSSNKKLLIRILIKFLLLLVVRHLFLIAFLLLPVRHLLLLAGHGSRRCGFVSSDCWDSKCLVVGPPVQGDEASRGSKSYKLCI